MKNKKVLIGVIAGVAVVSLAGILLSTEKGAGARKKIAGKVKDLESCVKDWVGDLFSGKKTEEAVNTASGMRLNTMG